MNDCIWDHEVQGKLGASLVRRPWFQNHENSKRKREEGREGKKEETRGGWLGHCLKRVRFSVSSLGIGEKKDEKN